MRETSGKITVLEEERLPELSSEVKFHKERFVHVFIDPGKNTLQHLSEIKKSMEEAIKMSIRSEKIISNVIGSCGLRCMKCIYPEGCIGGNFEQDIWTCGMNESHYINCNTAFETDSYDPGKDFIIRRYASLVSI